MDAKALYCCRDEAKKSLAETESMKLYNYSIDIIEDIIERLIAQIEIQLPVNHQEIIVGDEEMVAWHVMNSAGKGIYLLSDGRLVIYTPPESDGKGILSTKGCIEDFHLVRITRIYPDIKPSEKTVVALLGKLSHNNMLDNFGVKKDPRWYLTPLQLEARARYDQQEMLLAQQKRSVISWVKRSWGELRKIF